MRSPQSERPLGLSRPSPVRMGSVCAIPEPTRARFELSCEAACRRCFGLRTADFGPLKVPSPQNAFAKYVGVLDPLVTS